MKTLRTHLVKSFLNVKTLEGITFYKGMVMTLDSYRRKGGYFGSTANHYFGIFFTYENAIYLFDMQSNKISMIASKMKKHAYPTWVCINYDSFNKMR